MTVCGAVGSILHKPPLGPRLIDGGARHHASGA